MAAFRVEESVCLADLETEQTGGLSAEEARAEMGRLVERIADLQARLYAEESRAVLVVLQGIDAAGKDSSVKHVFRGTTLRACGSSPSRSRPRRSPPTTSSGATTATPRPSA